MFGNTKIPHALLGMGSAALAAAVDLPRKGNPNFPQGINEALKKKKSSAGFEDQKIASSIKASTGKSYLCLDFEKPLVTKNGNF